MNYAKLEWRDGQPYNPEYGDVYYSLEDGEAETEHVFVQHNNLPERFSSLQESQFVIAETGFGSGLNFLVVAKHWLELQKDKSKTLYFYSVEKSPFTYDDLKKAHQAWPQYSSISAELLSHYQLAGNGFHYMELFGGKIKLILMIGEVHSQLEQISGMTGMVDAWLLDGFAPGCNPAMWEQGIFDQIQRLSYCNQRGQTTFSTYTAAGFVRRGLQAAGFNVRKVAGYGTKREMVCGEFAGVDESIVSYQNSRHGIQPWYEGCQSIALDNKHACIIGAGIAGITTAWSLIKRGFKVDIYEQGESFGAQASGNLKAMLMPRISLQDSADAEFYSVSYLYALQCLQHLDPMQQCWQQTGGIQLPSSERNRKQIEEYNHAAGSDSMGAGSPDIAVQLSGTQAVDVSGVDIHEKVHYFPLAAKLSPLKVLQALIDRMGESLTIHYNSQVSEIKYSENNSAKWQLLDESKQVIATTECLVCANAWQLRKFEMFKSLYLQPARGQVSYLKANEKSEALKLPVSYEGYLLPEEAGQHVLGASFELDDCGIDLREQEHEQNLEHAEHWFDDMFKRSDIQGGRASVRAVTPDRTPILGAVAVEEEVRQEYADLYLGKPAHKYKSVNYYPGVYINTGHGARGFTSAFLSAELLASTINNEPLPVSNRVRYALHSSRFLIRSLKKRKQVKSS